LGEGRTRPFTQFTLSIAPSSRAIIFLSDETKTLQKLRERGIYSLSDGREFVVHAVFRGGYVFYTPEDWQLFGPHAYESDADGRMRWTGLRSDWRTEDLIDTSRTARPRSYNSS
jgi:hypothetical protein